MLEEYTSLTEEQSRTYCAGSEKQRVRRVIAARVSDRSVTEFGCGPGIDAAFYRASRYEGVDVSEANIVEARRRNPGHYFACAELPINPVTCGPRADCVYLKSVLEHTENVEIAVALLKNAMLYAREEVFVAWHTPPGDAEILRRVTGHFGKTVNQNTYAASAFDFANPLKEQIDNFELWTIKVPR